MSTFAQSLVRRARRGTRVCMFVSAALGLSAVSAATLAAANAVTVTIAPATTTGALDSALAREIYRMVFEDRRLLHERVEAALRRYVDNPEKVEIHLEPDVESKLLGGRFKEISLRMEDTVVKDLRVRNAFVRLRNCVLDFEMLLRERKFRFRDQGEVDLLLTVGERDLNDLFSKKRQKLKVRNPHIEFRPGHIRFSGGLRVLFLNHFVKVDGRLYIQDGNKVYFSPRWMSLNALPVPRFIVSAIAKRVNPLATFEAFKFKVDLGVVETTNDALYLATESMRAEVQRRIGTPAAAAAPEKR